MSCGKIPRWCSSRLNVPGSNNDTLPWTGSFADPTAQAAEVSQRTAADIRWLDAAFDVAAHDNAKAVVIGLQADMWDPAALRRRRAHGYTSFVQHLADRVVQFGGPVLLLNGDSHVVRSGSAARRSGHRDRANS